ncbi:MAG: hypothetical protein H6680_06585 [Desulfobacteraceae bacterium]|nr:hypothetical protein [Desulfobacteraceae bacterium]
MKKTASVFITALIIILFPDTSYSIQAHGGSEGIVVHQLGHIFFLFSLLALGYWLKSKWALKGKSKLYLRLSCLFLVLWNFDVIIMHFLDEQSGLINVSRNAFDICIRSAANSHILEYLYYFGKMDHILCVPALFFLYKGLKSIETEKGD